jgi:RHS repeat-associated protein
MISTQTFLGSSANPAAVETQITFTVTIKPASGPPPTLTGVARIYDGNILLFSTSSFTYNSGPGTYTAQWTTNPLLLAGTHSLTAVYSGDSNYSQSSTTSTLSQSITKATVSSTSLTLSPSSPLANQAVTLTALLQTSVTAGQPIIWPTGTVTFTSGGSTIGTATLVPNPSNLTSVIATLTTTLLAGTPTLAFSYPGDSNFNSAAGSATPTVNKAPTTTTVSSSPNPAARCQPVTFSAPVTSIGVPTGTVIFLNSGTPLATIALSSGVAAYTTSALPAATYTVSAVYTGDANYSMSYGNTVNQVVGTISNWGLSAAPAAPDPQQGVLIPFGAASIQPLTGGLLRSLPIDPNQHVDAGGSDNCRAGRTPLSLAYSSASLNIRPIILANLASDFCSAVPSQIQAQLTWNSVPLGTVTFSTTGHNPGDVYAMPLQVTTPVTFTYAYPWQVEVWATVGTFVYDRVVTGTMPVVFSDPSLSPFGAGWNLGGTSELLSGPGGVVMFDSTTGGNRFFSGSGPTYTSPANDQGTIAAYSSGPYSYTYTAKDQTQTLFDVDGRMIGQVDPHGLRQTFTYDSITGLLNTIAQPDGGLATFTYSGGRLATIAQPGGYFLYCSYDGSNNLIGVQDAAGGVCTFGYDGYHRLTNDQVGPLNATYIYNANNWLTVIDRGLGTALSITPQATQGLGGGAVLNAGQAASAVIDPNSNTTSYVMDTLGRLTQLQTPDSALQTWTLDGAGNPTAYLDQFARLTTYAYDAAEDLTGVTFPNGASVAYEYDATFHQVTDATDENDNTTYFSYHPTTSDLLTRTDALSNVTTYTWSNGLLQTMMDALGRVTTSTWNTARQMTAMYDALNNMTSYAYDGAGNQSSVTDARSNTTASTYDGNRRLLTRTNAIGGVSSVIYDMAGHTLESLDELGRLTTYAYDQRGWQVSLTEAAGTALQRTTATNYDPVGNRLSVTDPLSKITSYAYDKLNRMVATYAGYGSAVQQITTSVFDNANNVISSIDGRATKTSYGYDARNRRVLQIEAYGTALQRSTTTVYTNVGLVYTVTNPLGVVTSYAYDTLNRQTMRTDAVGQTVQRSVTRIYDSVGNVLSTTNPVTATTSYAYDKLNRATVVYEAWGSAVQRATTSSFDPVGNVASVTNPRGNTTTYTYDALNRRTQSVSSPLLLTIATVFDAGSNVLSQTDGRGTITSYLYDTLNRRTQQLDAYGTALQRTLSMVYDADDNLTASIDAQGLATTYAYDALNRRVSVEDAAGALATTLYDNANNVVTQIDQLGHTTTFTFDVLNRKTLTTDALGASVTLVYDVNSRLVSLTDPVGNVTTWLYDLLNRKTQMLDPRGFSAAYGYDGLDRLTGTGDRMGQSIAYGYDLLNRKTGETWNNASGTRVNLLTFTYDPNNNLLTSFTGSVSGTTYASTMTYDALDRLASVQAPFSTSLTPTYDLANNRTLVQDSFGGTTTRTYDVLNRVTTMQFNGTSTTTLREDFGWTVRDQVATQTRYSDLAGSTKIGYSTFIYDPVRRLTNLQHQNGSGTVLANYANVYDLASRITSETLNSGTPTSYTYDVINELTNDSLVTYSYDLNGNRTMTGYTTSLANEMLTDPTWTYYYDKNGNMVGQLTGGNTGTMGYYGYDNRNRLLSALQAKSSGPLMQATYVYDAMGFRLEKDVWTPGSGTATTRSTYDGPQVWADLSVTNTLQTRYVLGDRVSELLAWITSGGAASWPLVDRLRSVRNVMSNTGVLLDTITYDGFGQTKVESNPSVGGNYKAFGYRSDSETGWLCTWWRYYDAVIGRWLQMDPMEFGAGDVNLFRYVGNNPTNATDPSGLWKISRNKNNEFATATTEKGDTIAGLGNTIGLDPLRYSSWLSFIQGQEGVLVVGVKAPKPLSSLNIWTPLAAGQIVFVPNIIYALWIGELGKLGRHGVEWDSNVRSLERLGFHVVNTILDNIPPSNNSTAIMVFDQVTALSRAKMLQGLFVWGHGMRPDTSNNSAMTNAAKTFGLVYSDFDRALSYKLGFVVLDVCHGAKGRKYISNDGVGSIFFGLNGLLVPFVNNANVWGQINPGEQGTDPTAPTGKPSPFRGQGWTFPRKSP